MPRGRCPGIRGGFWAARSETRRGRVIDAAVESAEKEEAKRRGAREGAAEPFAPFAPIHRSIMRSGEGCTGRIAEIRALLSAFLPLPFSLPLPPGSPCSTFIFGLHPHLSEGRRKVYASQARLLTFPNAYYPVREYPLRAGLRAPPPSREPQRAPSSTEQGVAGVRAGRRV